MNFLIYVVLGAAFLALALVLLGQRSRQRILEEDLKRTVEEMTKISVLVQSLQNQLSQQFSATSQLLQGQDQALSQRLYSVQELVADLRERMGKVEEISRRVEAVAQDLSGLQDLLRAPKARGVFGEWVLSELLAQVLPRHRFQEQYRFRDGSIVDAAIFLENAIVPVDAKFTISGFSELAGAPPEERKKFKKNLIKNAQKHVESIAQKYIKTEEGTTDFALMYIPAEGVFLELLTPEEDLDFLEYAWRHRVFPCSPNSFYSYLRAIAMGLRSVELARDVQALFQEIRAVENAFAKALKEFGTLGDHLRNAQRRWDEAEKQFKGVQEKLTALAKKEGE